MQPSKSNSFTYRSNSSSTYTNNSTRSNRTQNCRKNLQDTFDDSAGVNSSRINMNERSILSVLSLNDTRKVLCNSAERITKTFNTVRTTLGSMTQVMYNFIKQGVSKYVAKSERCDSMVDSMKKVY